MNNVLTELYYGRISCWEREPTYLAEEKAINRKIEDEKRYFIGKMSLDDVQRFQELESLYSQANEFSKLDAFRYGYRLGVLMTMEVYGKGGK